MVEEVHAYFYSFELTGVEAIDEILRRVARAGKAFHHTENWNDDEWGPEEGISHAEWIQMAADEAAEKWETR